MMVGAEAVWTGVPAALSFNRTDLAERAANQEHERLKRMAPIGAWPKRLLAIWPYMGFLQGGCGFDEMQQIVAEEREPMDFAATTSATQ